MVRALAIAILSVAGCGAHLDDGSRVGASEGVDASPVAVTPDAPAAVAADAAPDAPACFNGRVIYLAFEGVTIAQAATTDATQNQAAWIGVASASVPPYQASASNRNGLANNITDGVRAALAQFPITVVTQRPAAGPYVMIAFGGTHTDVGTNYTYATGDHDCGDAVKSDLGWVSDDTPQNLVVPITVGTIGWMLGLQGTTDPNDCMCGWANSCQWSGTTCTLSPSIATTSSASPATTCPGLATQDEQAAFHTAFCQ
jgi:hypothetical protein